MINSKGGATDEVITETRNGAGQKVIAIVRASSWGTFADCQLQWYYKNIEGLRLPSRGATVIGSAIHKGSAVYDQAVLDGRPAYVEEAVQAAADYVANPVTEKGEPQEIEYDEEATKSDALDFSVKLTAKYCREVSPLMKYAGIELKCTALDVTTEHGVVRLTGTTDRIVENSARQWGVGDFKSGKTAVGTDNVANTKGHGLQIGAYTLMSEQATQKTLGAGVIIGLQTNSKLRVGIGEIANPKLALVGTDEKPGMIEIFADVAKRGVFAPNPKSNLCSAKWCPAYSRCIYHD